MQELSGTLAAVMMMPNPDAYTVTCFTRLPSKPSRFASSAGSNPWPLVLASTERPQSLESALHKLQIRGSRREEMRRNQTEITIQELVSMSFTQIIHKQFKSIGFNVIIKI